MLKLFLVALALSWPHTLDAQQSIPRDFQRHVEQSTAFIEQLVEPHLSNRERRILQSLKVRVPRDWSFNAQASQGRITISAGSGWIFQQLASAQIADQFFGFNGCSLEYLEYMTVNIHENSIRASNGQSVRPVFSPEHFGRQFGGSCRGYRDDSVNRPELFQAYTGQLNASFSFLFLHELAHHTLGHLDEGRLDLRQSRSQEAAADDWAIRKMVEANLAPAGALPMWQFLAALGGESLESEIFQTHPLGIKRVRDALRLSANLHRERGNLELADNTLQSLSVVEELMPTK